MLDCIARIVSAVACPVSADLESGYGATADHVAATVAAAVELGVVGGNLEDVVQPGELLPGRGCLRTSRGGANSRTGRFVRAECAHRRLHDQAPGRLRRDGAPGRELPGCRSRLHLHSRCHCCRRDWPADRRDRRAGKRRIRTRRSGAGRCHPAHTRRRPDQRWRHPHSRRPYPGRSRPLGRWPITVLSASAEGASRTLNCSGALAAEMRSRSGARTAPRII